MGDTTVRVRQAEVDAYLTDPAILPVLIDAARPVVQDAKALAPKRTGRGAASIRSEGFMDGPEQDLRISWDQDHFYMYFQDRGTKTLPARTFLEDALEAHTQ